MTHYCSLCSTERTADVSSTLRYTSKLGVVTCWCGMPHAVPEALLEQQECSHRDGQPDILIYCPLGHTYGIAGEGEAARLRKRLEREEQRRKEVLERLEDERRAHIATKSQLTKTRKRVAGGACPCCKRSFVDLGRHMKTKHPSFAVEPS